MFLEILFRVLLERSIIFVSESIQKSSNAVQAIRAFVEPFSICHSVIPVLPQALFNYLDAPVPLLLGVSKLQLKENSIEPTNQTPISWIDLDDPKSSIWSLETVPIPSFGGLKDKIFDKYISVH